ncbi:hercynine metabolism small protein [Prochlorococcus sp. MIT 1341]|uniref:hercynine metabolism small protein n=1 Tax=Prochlorococcus sp. MIT 1341 TaxID=3096221 RepID=UPI002A74CD1B|nr:hercynine metabolism small protein [Prochlorococcus sp. MIT 1341]
MSQNEQREKIRVIRENMITQIEDLYKSTFENLTEQGIEDKYLAKITQLLLNSKEAAVTFLKQEVENPIITKAANPH